MGYAAAPHLQEAVYAKLSSAAELTPTPVYDDVPAAPPGTFILIGPEDVRDAGDITGGGARHRFEVSVISDAAGFLSAKGLAARISALLEAGDLTLAEGHLVSLAFERAQAIRLEEGAMRRITLTFNARIDL